MKSILLSLAINTYSCVIQVAAWVIMGFATKKRKIDTWHLPERRHIPSPPKNEGLKKTIWIHASSLGEAKILVTFLTILRKKYPQVYLVLTAVTDSGVAYLKGAVQDRNATVSYLPLDTLPLMKKLITRFKIQRVWLIETELWPAMLYTCKRHAIPLGLINARMEQKSYNAYKRLKWIVSPLLAQFDTVLAQDEQYAERFIDLGVSPELVKVMGNIKGEVTIAPLTVEKRETLRKSIRITPSDLVVTVGCVHPDEISVIQRAVALCKEERLYCRWIIVPRHVKKSQLITDGFGDKATLVNDLNFSDKWSLCVVNAFGVLEKMYSLSDAAILGGTFNRVGGHNVWESVQFGVPLFFGPHYHTQEKSCKKLLENRIGFQVDNAEDLAESLIHYFKEGKEEFLQNSQRFAQKSNDNTLIVEQHI